MGRLQEMYIMNRDGFTLLVVGFTGPKALQFKLDYINAFNAMERQLKSLVAIPNFNNPVEALLIYGRLPEILMKIILMTGKDKIHPSN
jgi:phage regulator Rha-like protein